MQIISTRFMAARNLLVFVVAYTLLKSGICFADYQCDEAVECARMGKSIVSFSRTLMNPRDADIEFRNAENFYTKALALAVSSGKNHELIYVYRSLADAYWIHDDSVSAKIWLKKVIDKLPVGDSNRTSALIKMEEIEASSSYKAAMNKASDGVAQSLKRYEERIQYIESLSSSNNAATKGQSLTDWIRENKGLTALAIIGGAIIGRTEYCKEKGGCLSSPSSSTSASSTPSSNSGAFATRNTKVARAEEALSSGRSNCRPTKIIPIKLESSELDRKEIVCSNQRRYEVYQDKYKSWKGGGVIPPDTYISRASGFARLEDIAIYSCAYDCDQ